MLEEKELHLTQFAYDVKTPPKPKGLEWTTPAKLCEGLEELVHPGSSRQFLKLQMTDVVNDEHGKFGDRQTVDDAGEKRLAMQEKARNGATFFLYDVLLFVAFLPLRFQIRAYLI